MTTLVSGASGFLGSRLVKRLTDQGYSVLAIYNSGVPRLDSNLVHWKKADILDVSRLTELIVDIDIVIHCAAIVSFQPSESEKMYEVNVNGTTNLLNVSLNAGVKQFIYISSVAALNKFNGSDLVTEGLPWDDFLDGSLYGKTKFLAQREVWRCICEGMNAVIINPSIILGDGDWMKGSSAIFKKAFDEFPWYSSGSTGVVDVEDVVDVILLLIGRKNLNGCYVVNGANISFFELMSMIAKCFGKRPPYKRASSWLSEFIWRFDSVMSLLTNRNPILTKETTRTAMAKVSFSSEKLLSELENFRFRPLGETIDRICLELKRNHQL